MIGILLCCELKIYLCHNSINIVNIMQNNPWQIPQSITHIHDHPNIEQIGPPINLFLVCFAAAGTQPCKLLIESQSNG